MIFTSKNTSTLYFSPLCSLWYLVWLLWPTSSPSGVAATLTTTAAAEERQKRLAAEQMTVVGKHGDVMRIISKKHKTETQDYLHDFYVANGLSLQENGKYEQEETPAAAPAASAVKKLQQTRQHQPGFRPLVPPLDNEEAAMAVAGEGGTEKESEDKDQVARQVEGQVEGQGQAQRGKGEGEGEGSGSDSSGAADGPAAYAATDVRLECQVQGGGRGSSEKCTVRILQQPGFLPPDVVNSSSGNDRGGSSGEMRGACGTRAAAAVAASAVESAAETATVTAMDEDHGKEEATETMTTPKTISGCGDSNASDGNNDSKSLNQQSQGCFIASQSFEGVKSGFVFKAGPVGTGYYRDSDGGDRTQNDTRASAEAAVPGQPASKGLPLTRRNKAKPLAPKLNTEIKRDASHLDLDAVLGESIAGLGLDVDMPEGECSVYFLSACLLIFLDTIDTRRGDKLPSGRCQNCRPTPLSVRANAEGKEGEYYCVP